MKFMLAQRGFALPTVIISSLVMMLVLLGGLTALSSISVSLDQQRVDQLAREAAESGAARAVACIENGAATWTSLTPGTNCSGSGSACTSASTCVLWSTTERTSFTVSAPVETPAASGKYVITSTGYHYKVRSSGSAATTATSVSRVTYDRSLAQASASDSGTFLGCGLINRSTTTYKPQAWCWSSNANGRLGAGHDGSGSSCGTSYAADPIGAGGACVPVPRPVKRDVGCTGAIPTSCTEGNGGDQRYRAPAAYGLDVDVAIATGNGFACMISAKKASGESLSEFLDRRVFCWGSNENGQLGAGQAPNHSIWSGGSLTGCTYNSGGGYADCNSPVQVYGASANAEGWMADGSTDAERMRPVEIAAGTGHTCVLAKTHSNFTSGGPGMIYCWGHNNFAQSTGVNSGGGVVDPATRNRPFDIGDLTTGSVGSAGENAIVRNSGSPTGNVRSLGTMANSSHTCVTRTDYRVYCWGRTNFAQSGIASSGRQFVPHRITASTNPNCDGSSGLCASTDLRATTVATAALYGDTDTHGNTAQSCAITESQSSSGTYHANIAHKNVYCWGYQAYGATGNSVSGTEKIANFPQALATRVLLYPTSSGTGSSNYTTDKITMSHGAVCALATMSSAKNMYCWGSNRASNLAVSNSSQFAGVIGGDGGQPTSCAQLTGTYNSLRLRCDVADTGSENVIVRSRAVPITWPAGLDASQVTNVAGGAWRICAIMQASNYCWGPNSVGQVGDGYIVSTRYIPTKSRFLESASVSHY